MELIWIGNYLVDRNIAIGIGLFLITGIAAILASISKN